MPGLAAIQRQPLLGLRQTVELDDAVSDLVWSDDAAALLVGTAAGSLYRLNPAGRKCAHWPAHDGGITRVALKPGDSNTLASAGEDGQVVLWDARCGDRIAVLAIENGWVEHLAWTPHGDVLASAARKTISLWRGTESLGIWYDARRQVLALAWAPDGRRLATAANKGLYLWRMDDAQQVNAEPMQLLSFPGAPVALAWKPDNRALAVGTQDGFLQVWRPARDNQDNARQLTMRGYPSKVNCLAWHPDEALIATAGGPDVVLWDLATNGRPPRGQPLRHHQDTITALAWSTNGSLLATGDRAGRLCIWDRDGEPVFTRQLGHEIALLRWRPDDTALAVGDAGGKLHLLDREQSHNDPMISLQG